MSSPQTFDSYRVLREISSNATHRLCEAHDSTLERRVVLQTPLNADGDEASRTRFIQGARALAAANHPHVVTVFEVVEGTTPYAVLETTYGTTLREALRYFPPSRVETLRIMREIVDALIATEANGLTPIELTLDRIWLVPAPLDVPEHQAARVKLRDFRLAQLDDAARDRVLLLRALGGVLCELLKPHDGDASMSGALGRLVGELVNADPQHPLALLKIAARLSKLEASARRRKIAWKPLLAMSLLGAIGGAAAMSFVPRESVNSNAVTTTASPVVVAKAPLPPLPESLPTAPLPKPPEEPLQPALIPPHTEWLDFVPTLPSAARLKAVSIELQRRNPKFDGMVRLDWYERDQDLIRGVVITTDEVTDLMPVRAFPELITLAAPGKTSRSGRLEDLTPLIGLKIETLRVGWTRVKDLRPIAELPLKRLECGGCRVEELSPISNLPLEELEIWGNPIRDLSPLNSLTKLKKLRMMNTLVTDLSPLSELPIEELHCENSPIRDWSSLAKLPLRKLRLSYDRVQHADLLRAIPTLETINDQPAREVLQ